MRTLTLVSRFIAPAALVLGIAACGGDKKAAENDGPSVEEFKKQQAARADSVIRSAPTEKKLVATLGTKFEIGTVMLRDSIEALAMNPKDGCFDKGRKLDPYLAGIVTLWVNMSVIGTDVIRIQESHWTSGAGAIVDDCLNTAASKWKLSAALGMPAAYVIQVRFR